MSLTLADKIWREHRVLSLNKHEDLIYIDMHLLHEVNTPQAFDGLRAAGLKVRRPDLTLATEDHNTPTSSIEALNANLTVRRQIDLLRQNCAEFKIPMTKLGESNQGIVHVIAPEQGLVYPGSTIVCCDSHTATLGAFGALAFGIGTSQVEHVLATQTLLATRFKNMRINVINQLPANTTAKDLALTIINKIGTGGGQGCVIEYAGDAVRALSMEGRMTLCNMTVEAGASAGIIGVDDITVDYLIKTTASREKNLMTRNVELWRECHSDIDAVFDQEVTIDAAEVSEMVTWGTNPAQSVSVTGVLPNVEDFTDANQRLAAEQAFQYMKLQPGRPIKSIKIDTVFIGSCTNSRIEDLRIVAKILNGKSVHTDIKMIIVPGSMKVRQQAIKEGLDIIFFQAGADFRALSGCSMCVGINKEDRLSSGQRSVSTTNRNFEGRQGEGVMTHIASPSIAAASAILGRIGSSSDL